MREVQRRETRSRVLASADELFRTVGFAEATIRDIARHAAVSVGTVISVGDKNTLLVKCFDGAIAEIHHERAGVPESVGAPTSSSSPNVSVQITELLAPFARLFMSDPELARSYASILVAGSVQSEIFGELARVLISEITTVMQRAEVPSAKALAESLYFAYVGRLFTWPAGKQSGVGGERDNGLAELMRSLGEIVAAMCESAGGQR